MQCIKGKLIESAVLKQQAASNIKEQFATSPDLPKELSDAVIDALDAHYEVSSLALGSDTVWAGLLDLLVEPRRQCESLRSLRRGLP